MMEPEPISDKRDDEACHSATASNAHDEFLSDVCGPIGLSVFNALRRQFPKWDLNLLGSALASGQREMWHKASSNKATQAHSGVFALLFTITKNKMLDRIRKRKRDKAARGGELVSALSVDPVECPDELDEDSKQSVKSFCMAIESLPEALKPIADLYFNHQITTDNAIGASLAVGPWTAGRLRRELFKYLRHFLENANLAAIAEHIRSGNAIQLTNLDPEAPHGSRTS